MPISERNMVLPGLKGESMANEEIRNIMNKKRIRQYEVAEILGVTEFAFSRWLRKELPDDKKKLVINAINDICNSEGL